MVNRTKNETHTNGKSIEEQIFSFQGGKELMEKLNLLWDDLREGKIDRQDAAELHNGAGKMIRLYMTQVAHLALLKSNPNRAMQLIENNE